MRQQKTFLLVLASVVAVAAIACGSNAVPPPPASPPPASAPPVSPPADGGGAPPSAELGKALASQHGCAACHSTDGNISVGPTWKGLFGKEETLTGDAKVTVDEDYLRESIVAPNAKMVEGFFAGVMPQDFGTRLSQQEVQSLVEYIKTLR